MFVVSWNISDSIPSWTYGIFTTLERAQAAKNHFIEFLSNNKCNLLCKDNDPQTSIIFIELPGKIQAKCMLVYKSFKKNGIFKTTPIYIATGIKDAERFIKHADQAMNYSFVTVIIDQEYSFDIGFSIGKQIDGSSSMIPVNVDYDPVFEFDAPQEYTNLALANDNNDSDEWFAYAHASHFNSKSPM